MASHTPNATEHGDTFKVIATDRSWQGSVSDLTRLIAARFGLPEEAVREALSRRGQVEVASGVGAQDADRLRDVLARIGVTALLEPHVQDPALKPDPAQPARPSSRAPTKGGDTILDLRGHSKPIELTPPGRPRNTMLNWASREGLPGAAPDEVGAAGDEGPLKVALGDSGLKVELPSIALDPPLHKPSRETAATPPLARPAVLVKAEPALAPAARIDPLKTPAPPSAQPTLQMTPPPPSLSSPRASALSAPAPSASALSASVLSALETSASAPSALKTSASAPQTPPFPMPTVDLMGNLDDAWGEVQRAETPPQASGLRPIRRAQPEAPDDGPTRTDLTPIAQTGGWASILGDALAAVPAAPAPLAEGSWEASFEVIEGTGEGLNPADLFDSSNLDDVARLAAGAALDISPEGIVTRKPPASPSRPPARFSPPARVDSGQVAAPAARSKHDPRLAGLLTALFPGAGQVYNGQPAKGLMVGLTFWLLVPWALGVRDAVYTARSIAAGMFAPEGAGNKAHSALYAAAWIPVMALALVGIGRGVALLSPAEAPKESVEANQEAIIEARGAALIATERAFYRGDKARQLAEEGLRRAGEPTPGDPGFGLSQSERERQARTQIAAGAAACGRREYIQCQELMRRALALDPTNTEAWRYMVLSQQQLADEKGSATLKKGEE